MIEIDTFSSWIGLETQASKHAIADRLELEDGAFKTSDIHTLQYIRAKFVACKQAYKKDPTFFPKCKEIFTEIASIEEKLTTLLDNSSLEEETYSELLFLKPYFQPFNFIPFVLFLWSTLRIYIIPGMALLIPFFILLSPYLILTYLFHIPITFANYTQILNSIISGNIDFLEGAIHEEGVTLKQCLIMSVTLIQGVIQPYWNYVHLHSVDEIIQEHGRLILRYKTLYDTLSALLQSHGFTFFTSPLPHFTNERDAVACIILRSNTFKIALRYIGSLEVLMTLAAHPDIHPVRWITSPHPVFHANNIVDFQVSKKESKPISIQLHKQRHALLTGPNKGGKSTVLRAITTSILLAHTYGCAIGHLTLTPFSAMHVCLKPDDLPGSKSRFEREMEFTSATLRTSAPILVLIDELYHSTNPPDALRSCEIYCNQLWKKPNVVSVISTHLFTFVEKASADIQRLCCPAIMKNKEIQFQYGLKKGICTLSSVDLLLRKNGLLDASEISLKNPIELQNDVQQ